MSSRIFPQTPTMRTGTPLHSPLIVGTVGSVSKKALARQLSVRTSSMDFLSRENSTRDDSMWATSLWACVQPLVAFSRRSRGESDLSSGATLYCPTCAKHLSSLYFLPRPNMNRVPDRNRDTDDDQQWEDLPDEKLVPHLRSSSRSGSFKGTAAAPRTRRTTRQRAIFPSTSPRKHLSSDSRSPVRTRRGRDFVPPLDLLGTSGSEHEIPIKPLLPEPIGTVQQCSSAVELPSQLQ